MNLLGYIANEKATYYSRIGLESLVKVHNMRRSLQFIRKPEMMKNLQPFRPCALDGKQEENPKQIESPRDLTDIQLSENFKPWSSIAVAGKPAEE
jgi:hypothetical protein